MKERTIADWADLIEMARVLGCGPIAVTTDELDAMRPPSAPGGAMPRGNLPITVFGYPVVEVQSWPRWLETAARQAVGDLCD